MQITETLQEISLWELEGEIEDAIDMLIEVRKVYNKTHTNLRLYVGWYSDEEFLKLKGDREETEQEAEARISKEKASAERNRLDKLAQLNKLKQELGIN